MSEYAHSPSRAQQLSQPEALFDDATFPETQYLLNVELPKLPSLEVHADHPTEGVSVELGARALALHNIMGTFNQLNKAMGVRKTFAYADNTFEARYSEPELVIENMGRKAAKMERYNREDYRTLNATRELIAAGFDPAQTQLQEALIQRDLLNDYGPGKSYAPNRKKVASKASAVAIKSNKAR